MAVQLQQKLFYSIDPSATNLLRRYYDGRSHRKIFQFKSSRLYKRLSAAVSLMFCDFVNHVFCKGKTVRLVASLNGLESTKQKNVVICTRVGSKATETKPVKLETSHKVILPSMIIII